MVPNSPLELVSLSHARQNDKLAVSGLVRNPVAGKPVESLSAVVFLFDRMGTFVTSSRANVDFLKLGAGDEIAVRGVARCAADGGALSGQLPDR